MDKSNGFNCQICNLSFKSINSHLFFKHSISSKEYYLKYILKVNQPPKCLHCGEKNTSFRGLEVGFAEYCSSSCVGKSENSKEKFKQTCLKKYGVNSPFQSEEVKEKFKRNCLKKYGVENPFQSEKIRNKAKVTSLKRYGSESPIQTKEVKEKSRQTCLKKYGVNAPFQSEEVRNTFKRNCLKKYGVENPFQSKEIKEKIKKKCFEKYGVEHYIQVKEVRDKSKATCLKRYGVDSYSKYEKYRKKKREEYFNNLIKNSLFLEKVEILFTLEDYRGVNHPSYPFKCKKCFSDFSDSIDDGHIPRCPICYPKIYGFSQYETEIVNWLKTEGILNIETNTRKIINPLELDIYLHDYKLAIEFNGLYWHSEISGGKDKKYHLHKLNMCKEKNIELIQIFEDEWVNKENIVKSIIRNKLGLIKNKIHARKCEVSPISKEEIMDFLKYNHLQGNVSGKIDLGLFYEEELVQVITIGISRFNKNYAWEILRNCNKINTIVVGGFNKLLKYAIDNFNLKSLISYVDKRYFTGNSYSKFTLLGESNPNYWYLKLKEKNLVRESRIKYQKHKLDKNSELTEWQLMQLKGYDRIWDCGNKVYGYLGINI